MTINFKKNILSLGLFLSATINSLQAQAQILSEENPLKPITEKGNSFIGFFSGDLAIMFFTLSILVCTAMWFAGKLSTFWAVRIGIAMAIVSAAPSIVTFMFSE